MVTAVQFAMPSICGFRIPKDSEVGFVLAGVYSCGPEARQFKPPFVVSSVLSVEIYLNSLVVTQ